jgi:glycosyltransferase involved in cell wall biosynthesis
MEKPRLLRITTVPISLHLLLNGQLAFTRDQGFEVLTASADGPEISRLHEWNITHRIIPMTRKITPLQDLWCIYLLVKLIKSFGPDIVHTHTPKAGLLGMVAAWLCRVPIRMHTVAGIPYQESAGFTQTILRCAERITYMAAHRVYPNSVGLQQFMVSEFPGQQSKYRVLGHGSSNGVNTEFFKPTTELVHEAASLRGKYGIGPEDWVACFVGRLVRNKGVGELVDAFDQFSPEKKNTWLFLVGQLEDELDPLPSSTVAALQQNKSVISPGFQEDIRPWIMASNVLVLPSYREGFPNVLLQAGALQKPCIATDINGCNEIVLNHETGLLVPAKDAKALEDALVWCYANREEAAKWGKNAGSHVINKFSQSYIWNELMKEYRQLLSLVSIKDQTALG